jgi:hypothetical protein
MFKLFFGAGNNLGEAGRGTLVKTLWQKHFFKLPNQ